MRTPRNLLLVDGYNVIHKIEDLRVRLSVSLESARTGLAGVVAGWRFKHPGFECRIVFDGKDSKDERNASVSGVPCTFTAGGRDADDEILSVIKARQEEFDEIVVVSEDNYVRNNCRAHKVRIENSEFLLPRSSGKPGSSSSSGASQPNEKALGRKAVSEINDEIRRAFGLSVAAFLILALSAVPAHAKNSPETMILKANREIQADPNDAKAYYNRGSYQLELGNLPEAVKDFTKSIELEPKAADTYFNRGLAMRLGKKNAEALLDFSKAIELYPNHAGYYFERCNTRIVTADYAGAVADAEAMVRLAPKDAEGHFMLGLAQHLGGDSVKGLAAAEKALELKSWHKNALRLKEEILAA